MACDLRISRRLPESLWALFSSVVENVAAPIRVSAPFASPLFRTTQHVRSDRVFSNRSPRFFGLIAIGFVSRAKLVELEKGGLGLDAVLLS